MNTTEHLLEKSLTQLDATCQRLDGIARQWLDYRNGIGEKPQCPLSVLRPGATEQNPISLLLNNIKCFALDLGYGEIPVSSALVAAERSMMALLDSVSALSHDDASPLVREQVEEFFSLLKNGDMADMHEDKFLASLQDRIYLFVEKATAIVSRLSAGAVDRFHKATLLAQLEAFAEGVTARRIDSATQQEVRQKLKEAMSGTVKTNEHRNRTPTMKKQLKDFSAHCKDNPRKADEDADENFRKRAFRFWNAHKDEYDAAAKKTGDAKGYKDFTSLAQAMKNSH